MPRDRMTLHQPSESRDNLRVLNRPVALMLALIPAGALAFSYCAVKWTSMMMAQATFTNPELANVIEGYRTFFGDYAIPVLALSVVLAALNLCCAFSRHTQVTVAD